MNVISEIPFDTCIRQVTAKMKMGCPHMRMMLFFATLLFYLTVHEFQVIFTIIYSRA